VKGLAVVLRRALGVSFIDVHTEMRVLPIAGGMGEVRRRCVRHWRLFGRFELLRVRICRRHHQLAAYGGPSYAIAVSATRALLVTAAAGFGLGLAWVALVSWALADVVMVQGGIR